MIGPAHHQHTCLLVGTPTLLHRYGSVTEVSAVTEDGQQCKLIAKQVRGANAF